MITEHQSENHLQGQTGEVRMTIQVTRAATGAVEEYHLVGKCTEDDLKEIIQSNPAEE